MNGLSSNGFPSDRSRVEPLSTRGIMAAGAQDLKCANTSASKSPNKSVGFFEEKGEVKEKRERFLTAKYGVRENSYLCYLFLL